MLTKEQEEKAREALYLRLPMFQNFEKEMAFNNHKTAIAWVNAYNLPYRISLDYLKAINADHVRININYPFPGYRVADLIHLSPNEYMLHDPMKAPDNKGRYTLELTPIDEATKQRIEEHNKNLRPWDLSTAAGIEKWKYYFAHFFNVAQLNEYNSFDWFGVKAAPNEEQEKKINFWISLQADYQMNPDKYMQEEPLKANYNLDEYTELSFIPDKENISTQYSNSMM